MIKYLLAKYKEIGWDISKWKKKKELYLKNIEYDINNLMIINWILGYLNKEGIKYKGFFILTKVLLSLKKKSNKKLPQKILVKLLSKWRQNILLYNKKKGTLFYELPRFLSIEKSIKKVIEWWIKGAKKYKKNLVISSIQEIKNIFKKEGEIFKRKKYIKNMIKKNKPFFYLLKKKKK